MEIEFLPSTLKVLELSDCNIHNNNISLNSFYLLELEILKMNSNGLCLKIEDYIGKLNKLKLFECKDNKFHKFETLSKLTPNLEIFKCSKNRLKHDSFINLPSGLKILDCSYNLIENLENLPIKFEILACSYNYVSNLDYLPSSIIRLNCTHNQITNLDNIPNTTVFLTAISNPITQLENLPQNI